MKRLLLLLFMASVAIGYGAGVEQYEVARWSFTNGSLAGKPATLPLELRGTGREQTTSFSKGWLQLQPGALLFTENLNASKFSNLAKSVTIWCRFRVDAASGDETAFPIGFTTATTPADWKQMALCMLFHGTAEGATLGPFGYQDDGQEFGAGPSRMLPVRAGEDICAALAYNAAGGTATLWVNGATCVAKLKSPTPLKSFTGFGIGRLKAVGAASISIRECRIYSVAFNPEWMEEISAAAREAK